jgi:hypothetical protein
MNRSQTDLETQWPISQRPISSFYTHRTPGVATTLEGKSTAPRGDQSWYRGFSARTYFILCKACCYNGRSLPLIGHRIIVPCGEYWSITSLQRRLTGFVDTVAPFSYCRTNDGIKPRRNTNRPGGGTSEGGGTTSAEPCFWAKSLVPARSNINRVQCRSAGIKLH